MTAAARARETARADRLFADPWAALLAGDEGFALLDAQGALVPGVEPPPTFVVRHRFFDDYLLSKVTAGTRQVVLVAAGLDTRAFRLDWLSGVCLFELDQESVLTHKQKVLDGAGAMARCERRAVAVDLREDWPTQLIGAGFQSSKPTAWLAEGLLFYLPESAVHALLAHTAGLSCPGSSLGADVMSTEMLQDERRRAWVQFYADAGAPLVFGTDDPESLLASHGWQATIHRFPDVSLELGKAWPMPRVPGPQGAMITANRAG
jgi:methyltransferase (TIGR00027 family)